MTRSQSQRQAGRISQKQLIAIIAIVLAGLGVSAVVLTRSPSAPAGEAAEESHGHGHGESKGHDDAEHHGEKKSESGHDEAKGHDDKEHHEKAEEHGEHDKHEGETAPEKGAAAANAGKHEEGEEEPVSLNAQQIAAAGVEVQAAQPGKILSTVQLSGEIKFNEDRTAHVVPRVGGVVESVSANLGQQVKKGQVLAVISSVVLSEQRSELQAAQKRLTLAQTTYDREKKLFEDKISPQMDLLQATQALREAEIAVNNANQKLKALGASPSAGALNRYELRAPFDAVVVEKHIALGESVKEDANVFTLSDLSTVWATINVPAKDLNLVKVGEKVTVRSISFDATAKGTVTYVGSLIGEQTRTATARVVLTNPDLSWRPGLFVNVAVTSGETEAPVTVTAGAVQTMEGRQVVFVEGPGGFQAKPVEVGHTDGKRTEVVKGLSAGTRYAATNSFVIKAEIGKASAEHEH